VHTQVRGTNILVNSLLILCYSDKNGTRVNYTN